MSETATRLRRVPVTQAGSCVVRGATLTALDEAAAILDAARGDAARLQAEAADAAARLREATAAEVERRAAEETARRIASLDVEMAAWRRAREDELVSLAFAIAARIIGALPPDEGLERAARAALADHAGTVSLVLRTDPETAPRLRERLVDTAVTVRADDGCARGTCTLVHPRGQAAVSPIEQLRALLDATPGARP